MVWQDPPEQTPDPAALANAPLSVQKLHFAILEHAQREGSHWDILLELPQRKFLATWRVDLPPNDWLNSQFFQARSLPDHRPIYLDYQGPLTNNRGWVTRCDRGLITLLEDSSDGLAVELHGEKISCSLHFTPIDAVRGTWKVKIAAIRV